MCMSLVKKADRKCRGSGMVHRCQKSRTRREGREEVREKGRETTGAGDDGVGVKCEGSESA